MQRVLLLLVCLSLAGCASEDATSTTLTPVPSTTPSPIVTPTEPDPEDLAEVEIEDFTFVPATLTVRAGTTVTWSNKDAASHTATGNGSAFETGVLAKGDETPITFTTPGTFPYFCAIHPSMRGTILVTDANGIVPPVVTPTPPTAPENPTPSPSPSPSPAPTPETRAVQIQGFVFSPADITVTAGTIVEWTNLDGSAHTATANDNAWDSGTLSQNAKFSRAFSTPGTFAYKCKFHGSMTGTVTVTA